MNTNNTSHDSPSYLLEYGFYAVLLYGMLGDAWGISVRFVGAGLLAGLAVLCLMHAGQRAAGVYRPIVFGLGCGVFILLIQGLVHGESLAQTDMRGTVTWILSLLVIQTLSFRKGFLHRFAIVAFMIGCGTLPYLKTYLATEELVRVGVSSNVGLSNPNAFGMWFGFCYVYFLVKGLETQHFIFRMASWSIALLCAYLVAITVSRGPLLGMAIATVLACQKVLKRSFLPILVLLGMGWIIYMSGLLDTLIGYYTSRGSKDTGRLYLWTEALERFLNSFVFGVGFSNTVITLPINEYETGPHNSALFIGFSSGVVPFILFFRYLLRAMKGALASRMRRTYDAPFLLPMAVFACLEMMLLSEAFMSPWCMIVFSISAGSGYLSHASVTVKNYASATISGMQKTRNDVSDQSSVRVS